MPKMAGKSAGGKGSPKRGYVMAGSKVVSSTSGKHPPKPTRNIVQNAKTGR